jgi:hypothetical protein
MELRKKKKAQYKIQRHPFNAIVDIMFTHGSTLQLCQADIRKLAHLTLARISFCPVKRLFDFGAFFLFPYLFDFAPLKEFRMHPIHTASTAMNAITNISAQ